MAGSRRLRSSSWNRISLVYSCTSECKKIDANNYTTSMIGLKYKLAHKQKKKNGIPQIFHKKSDSYKYWKS